MKIIVERLKVFPSQSDTCLLDIPYLALNTNEITGLWGPSGSGKSTLINCLNGLVFFDQRYRTEGHIIFEKPEKTLFLKEGMPYQHIQRSLGIFTILQFLYEGFSPLHKIGTTLFDMVKPFYNTRAEFIDAAKQQIRELGLPSDTLQRYPDTLSGGEIQRCQLMAAMLCDVSYFLLDEVTSALDKTNRLSLLNKFIEFKLDRNCGSLLISHDREVIEHFTDRVLTIEKGAIISVNSNKIVVSNLNIIPKIESFQQQKVILKGVELSKTYTTPGEKNTDKAKILDKVNLNIREGHFVGLCGPSGSGKSTLGKILAGLELPDSGSIFLKGLTEGEQTVNDLKKRRLACPFLYQDALQSLHPAYTIQQTIHRNFLEAKAQNLLIHDDAIEKIMIGLNLGHNLLSLYPHQLSGGQAQRFQLMLALLFNPEILIMDEPFSFLDLKTVEQTMQFLQHLKEINKLSILCISHQTELLVPFCDEVFQLTSGTLNAKKTS